MHLVTSDLPAGYTVSYSVCINCTNHPALSYLAGISVPVIVPINGTVDVSWLYSPKAGTLQGSRVLPDGTPFTLSTLTLDSVQTIPSGTSTFSSNVSAGPHTVASSSPAGYSVAYSICVNCVTHASISYQQGFVANVTVPPDGYVDVRFQYTPLSSSTISVASPTANQTVTGSLTLSVAGGDLSKAASVEYRIGSNRIARVPAQSSNPTFRTTWNSALASDGNSQIEVSARDYLDNIIFQDVRSVVLNNFGNGASTSLSGTMSGSVPVTLNAFDRTHFPAYWQVFLDGEIAPGPTGLLFSDQDGVHTNARVTPLDTTIYPNGPHEFHFAFHSNDYPVTNVTTPGLDFRGMVTQTVNIDNGRALQEILPNFLFIYAPVSTGVQLTCSRVYTNQDRGSCVAPAYSVNTASSSPGMQVSPSGLVLGTQEGYGDILVSDGGRSATVHVWVQTAPGVPHFQDGGNYGTAYAAGKSLFAIAPFQLTPDLVQADATLLAETRRAGVNTLNKGIYLPNSNLSLPFATWKASYDSSSLPSSWTWSMANGFRVIGAGDDIARRPGWEATWTANWPAAQQAVQYSMQKFAQSGAGLSVDVVDESSALWGSNPTPAGLIGTPHAPQSAACAVAQCVFTWPSLADPLDYTTHDGLAAGRSFLIGGTSALTSPVASNITSVSGTQVAFTVPSAFSQPQNFNAGNSPNLEFLWFSGRVSCQGNVMCNPALPNNILSTVASWLRTAAATVSISWPPAGAALPYVQSNWMKSGGVSDYASHYWDSNQQRRTYVFGMGVRENQNSLLAAYLSRQSSVSLGRPQMVEQTMAGIDYLKYSAAGVAVYTPPVDILAHVGAVPRAVVSGIMTAAAAGAAGVKAYKYDNTYAQRRDSTGGGAEFESDASPSTGEVGNWQAMGYAASVLTKSLQEFVLGTPVNSPYLGRNLIAGARRTGNGNLLIVVNGWDSPRTVALDLTPYRTGNGILRYRVADTSIKLRALADGGADSIALAAGETALYLFPNAATVVGVDSVTFQPDASGMPTMLRINYLYSANTPLYGDPVDCSGGCKVKVDRKLGDVFYSYAVLDSTGISQCRSAAIPVPSGNTVTLPVNPASRSSVCQ